MHSSRRGDSIPDVGCATGDCDDHVVMTSPSSLASRNPRPAHAPLSDNKPLNRRRTSGEDFDGGSESDMMSSGRGPTGCRQRQRQSLLWNYEDDEDCTDDDALPSSGQGQIVYGVDEHSTKSRLKNSRLENVVDRGTGSDEMLGSKERETGSDVILGSKERENLLSTRRYRLQVDERDGRWSPTVVPLPVFFTRFSASTGSHQLGGIDRSAASTTTVAMTSSLQSNPLHGPGSTKGGYVQTAFVRSSPLPASVKATPASPSHQRNNNNHNPVPSIPSAPNQQHHPIGSSSSLVLNIALIVGVGTSVILLLLIAGYSVYRYHDGCLSGGQRGSYRLDKAASAGVDHHHAGGNHRLLLPSAGSNCGGPDDDDAGRAGVHQGGRGWRAGDSRQDEL